VSGPASGVGARADGVCQADLRIRQHPLFPPVLVWPADLEVEEELDTLEFEGGPLDWAGDTELLLQAVSTASTTLT
jgi:hypothetical protein